MRPSFPRKEIRILGKLLLVECGILGFGFQNTSRGIRNPTNNWNTEINSTDEKNPKTRTWNLGLINPWRWILGFPFMGRLFLVRRSKTKRFSELACSSRSDTRAGEKNSRIKKKRGELEGPPPPFSRCTT